MGNEKRKLQSIGKYSLTSRIEWFFCTKFTNERSTNQKAVTSETPALKSIEIPEKKTAVLRVVPSSSL